MTNTFGITARAYRWYADGTEAGASALANESTQFNVNNIADYPIVLRYGVQESGTGSASGATTDDYQLQYSKNGGAFTNVTSSSTDVRGYTSSSLTDAAATTSRLSAGTGSFVAGEIAETDGLLTDWQLTANNYSDLLFAIELVAADTAHGDVFTFRVLRNGGVFNTYSVTPQLTIANAYSLTTDSGSYTLTGTAVTPKYNRRVVAASGTYALTGTAASLVLGYKLTAASGSFALTGTDATLLHDRKVVAESGSYAMTGTAAGLLHNRKIVAGSGSFTLTGTDVTLTYGQDNNHTLTADLGSFALTGTDVTLKYGRVLPTSSGSFTATGTDVTLKYDRRAIAEPGSFAATGTDATLKYGRSIVAASDSFTSAGTDATLLYHRKLVAASGSFVITGTDATLTYDQPQAYTLTASAGSFALTGTDASLLYNRVIVAESGSFTWTGSPATLIEFQPEPQRRRHGRTFAPRRTRQFGGRFTRIRRVR